MRSLSPSGKKDYQVWLLTISMITDWTRTTVELVELPSLLIDRRNQLSAAGLCHFPISIAHAGECCHPVALGRGLKGDDESTRSMTSAYFLASSVWVAILGTPSHKEMCLLLKKKSLHM